MININLLGKTPIEIEYVPELTIREFMEYISDKKLLGETKSNDDFIVAFMKKGKIINTTENRHKKVSEFINDNDSLSAVYWILTPIFSRTMKGNLRKDYD